MGCIEYGELRETGKLHVSFPLLVDGLVRIGFQCFFNVLFRQVFLVGSGVIFLQTDNIGVTIYKIRQYRVFPSFFSKLLKLITL